MKVAEKIKTKINSIPSGVTFNYQKLGISTSEYTAAAKALERQIKQGVIKRVSTGIFYKPKQSAFGVLRPREEELLKPYLFQNGRRIAYVTGGSLYNRMGLTTQIPKTIKMASRSKRITTRIGNTQVKPAKSYVEVTDNNYQFLEYLDALKDFKTISDLEKKSAISVLSQKLQDISDNDLEKLIKYATKYPPRAIALLGALLEYLDKNIFTLKKNLNPLTTFKIGIKTGILPTTENWNSE